MNEVTSVAKGFGISLSQVFKVASLAIVGIAEMWASRLIFPFFPPIVNMMLVIAFFLVFVTIWVMIFGSSAGVRREAKRYFKFALLMTALLLGVGVLSRMLTPEHVAKEPALHERPLKQSRTPATGNVTILIPSYRP